MKGNVTPISHWLFLTLTGCVVFALPGCNGTKVTGVETKADNRPNVVIIITDDQNDYGFFKAYPGTKVPHLDDFKNTSITFRHAYTASPVCGPSRAAFFSGLYPHTTGAYLNGADPWRQGMLAHTENLPELFKRSGYKTFGNGKLFHAKLANGREANLWDNEAFHGGFGPFPKQEDRITGKDDESSAGAKFWGVTEWTGPDEDFPDVVNANTSIEFLQQNHDRPFLLVYGLWRPHTPFTAPKRFFDLYDPNKIVLPKGYRDGDLDDVPPYGHKLSKIWGHRWKNSGKAEPQNWQRILHGYLAATSFADWNVGRVIAALDKSQYADNTIVIFWSDNGYHLGEKNHYEKATVWEAAALIPAAMRLPGGKNNGKTILQPIVNLDFFPTLVDYCQLEKPNHTLEGKNLRPLLENPQTTWERPAITSYGEKVFSARDLRYRYIQYPDDTEELYDHENDPYEFNNLADDNNYDAIKTRLKLWNPTSWAPSLGGRQG